MSLDRLKPLADQATAPPRKIIKTGMYELDRKLNNGKGITADGLVVIGGASGGGKTAFTMQLLGSIINENPDTIGVVFEYDVSIKTLYDRELVRRSYELNEGSRETPLTMEEVSTNTEIVRRKGEKSFGVLGKEALESLVDSGIRVLDAMPTLEETTIEVGQDQSGLPILEKRLSVKSYTIDSMVSDLIALRTANPDKSIVAVVDYLQYVPTEDPRADEITRIDELCKKLQSLGLKYNILILAICTQTKEASKAKKSGGSASLTDLKGSASIGYCAELALGVDRMENNENYITITCTKSRMGALVGWSLLGMIDGSFHYTLEEDTAY